ncbi:MAG: transposase [Candidatus Acidiferrales bacterium]
MQTFIRKRNRLPANVYQGPHSYFLTLCCHERQKLFLNAALVQALLDLLGNACAAHSFEICAYCFMPDHFHVLLTSHDLSANLPSLVRAFKGVAAARARQSGIANLWQKGFYDHVIRATDSLPRVTEYILTNPVRAGLANTPTEWPFSGPPGVIGKTPISGPPYVPPWKEKVAG